MPEVVIQLGVVLVVVVGLPGPLLYLVWTLQGMQDTVDTLFKAIAHWGVVLSGRLLLGIGIQLWMWLMTG